MVPGISVEERTKLNLGSPLRLMSKTEEEKVTPDLGHYCQEDREVSRTAMKGGNTGQ